MCPLPPQKKRLARVAIANLAQPKGVNFGYLPRIPTVALGQSVLMSSRFMAFMQALPCSLLESRVVMLTMHVLMSPRFMAFIQVLACSLLEFGDHPWYSWHLRRYIARNPSISLGICWA